MKKHTTTQFNPKDLTTKLDRIKKSNSLPNDGDYISRVTRTGTDGTTSSADSVFSRLPAFRKSKTSSTTGSNEVSRLEVVRTIPTSASCRASAEIGQGEFSKPSVRRRRGTNESTKSHKEFQYYGRHANSWLFNDFSISDHIRKGWSKVFPDKHGSEP